MWWTMSGKVIWPPRPSSPRQVTSVGTTNFLRRLASDPAPALPRTRRTSYLGSNAAFAYNQARLQGYRAALEAEGITVPRSLSVPRNFLDKESDDCQDIDDQNLWVVLSGPDGEPLLLRGVCLGGWLNMENFITGYSANETLMRREVRQAIGDDRAERFFERLLTRFFDEPDAVFLGQAGLNLARIAVGYKHFEDDARPLEIKADGFRHLDRAIEALARHGVYSIVDLHALPGSQNHHWHSDNPTHVPAFWEHRHFQDRVVHLWEAIADHYRGNPWVAGYNLAERARG